MAALHALVRRLDSVETLGSPTFICTDKTGTLTRNEMSVVEAWTPAGRARISGTGYEPTGRVEAGEEAIPLLRTLAHAAVRCSTGRVAQKEGRWIARGDPMEAALDVFARRLGIDVEADEASVPVTKRFPFDPRRRRMSVVVGDRLFVKGAPDSVCPRCLQTKGTQEALQAMTVRGLRVIAVASRPAHGSASEAEATETELELLGLIGLEDPPRPHAAESVAACREAGIKVAMITGDHPATAEAIARDRPCRAGLHGPPGARTTRGRDDTRCSPRSRRCGSEPRSAGGQAAYRPCLALTGARRCHDRRRG
jgi:magnesium-transporting ATPase (P-type)